MNQPAVIEHEEPQVPVVHTPMMMIQRAIDNGADIVTIERLMALHERYEAAAQRRAYDDAMRQAQTEIQPIFPNAANTQTTSKYATFAAVDGAIRPIYTKHGLTLSFDIGEGAPENWVRITCEVSHTAGHHAHRHIDMPADGKGAKGNDVMTKTHAVGSAVSYGRRYLEIMIFNIAVLTKDDDGNTAGDTSGPKLIDDAQYRYLLDLIEKADADQAKLLAYLKAPDLATLTQQQYKLAETALRQNIAEREKKKKPANAR